MEARAPLIVRDLGPLGTAGNTGTMPTKITARTNGPLLIEPDGVTLCDQNGKAYATPNAAKFALCRCGGSANKPFCDGTHAKTGFACPPQP